MRVDDGEPAMPEIIGELEANLHARLTQWADQQQRPLPALVRDILAAAARVRANDDPTMDPTVRGIRRDRDGGCGLCDAIEPLFAEGKSGAPTYNLYVLDLSETSPTKRRPSE
jgi:hypothetical protein